MPEHHREILATENVILQIETNDSRIALIWNTQAESCLQLACPNFLLKTFSLKVIDFAWNYSVAISDRQFGRENAY